MKLNLETEKLLKKVNCVDIRKAWRKQLKNDLKIVQMYEKSIKEATEPEPPIENEDSWSRKCRESYIERQIELLPETRENKEKFQKRYQKCLEKLEEFVKGDQVTDIPAYEAWRIWQ